MSGKEVVLENKTDLKTIAYKLFMLTVAMLMLVSCQTIKEKETGKQNFEQTSMSDNTMTHTNAKSKPENQQNTESLKQNTQAVAYKTQIKNPQQDISSTASAPADTKKHIKTYSQNINSNGSMPNINYQSAASPVLKNDNKLAGNQSDTIHMNYEQVDIRQILEDVADALNLNLVIDPAVSGVVTMRTAPDGALSKKDLWPLLQILLYDAGISLENRKGIYYVRQFDRVLPDTIGNKSIINGTDSAVVMQITPLKNISIASAMPILKPVMGVKGKITEVPNLNTLLIINTPEQLKKINGLLGLIDSDPFKHRGIHLYKLKEAQAKKIAAELQDILKLIEGTKPSYQVMGLERINALLVVAPPGKGFKEVSHWVEILDAGADEELLEQIFVYKCKSMKATSLAATLNSIFLQEDRTVKKDKNSDNTESAPNEFKTVDKQELSFDRAVKREAKKQQDKTVKTQKTEYNHAKNEKAASADLNVTIVADEDTNSLLVRTTAKDYKQLLQTIRSLDRVPLQVLINVVIAQVTLTDSQSFGIDWSYFGSNGTLIRTNFGQAQDVGSDGNPLGIIINRVTSNWRVTLNALAQESDINILSRPSLLITNNDEGVINVGKEVPVETSNTTNTNTGGDSGVNVTQQIAYRKTGIELTVTPQINDDGMIDLEVKQGLSAIEGDTQGDNTGLNPTFTNQEINTSILVKDGETIILGGLIESVEVNGESGVPVLKDVPLMGNLFKSQGSQVERRELILIISTQVVDAEGNYNSFNESFKERYIAAAKYLDKQLAKDHSRKKQ